MPRNAEIIRQWSIMRDLESARRLTIADLADRTGVSTRTIRRDLEALQSAGFPLFDDVHDGKRYWMLEQRPFRRLDDTGFTLSELSALYFSRTLVECLASAPFQQDVRRAFEKLASALTPGMRQLLDRFPLAIQAKPDPGARSAITAGNLAGDVRQVAEGSARVARLLDGILHHRRVSMRYHSLSSDREKEYLIEPYRIVLAHGGLYVVAFVPEYRQQRTFFVDRVLDLSVTEERFEAVELEDEAFAHSLGVSQGTPPERIEVAFDRRIAKYVKERLWHPSQDVLEQPDGGLVLVLQVSNDWALRSWILGFGRLARVVAPLELAAQILDELEGARARYLEATEGAEATG
ncbi:MAG TPA: WYL domain-containing protein [Vicinamibacterales bacterium]|nr:WYL domain-containing protein [Vicinamibacterales bacterium]